MVRDAYVARIAADSVTGVLAALAPSAHGGLVSGLLAGLAFMSLAWIVSVARRDVSVIDALWGPGFVLLAWTWHAAAHATGARAWIACLLVTVWGIRLAAHIALRNRGRGEDPRYAEMRARSPRTFAWTSLVTVFWLQAGLLWVIALPVYATQVARPRPLGPLDALGLLAWLVGFAFEAAGDAQLAAFTADPDNRGRVMDRGLWRFTRHPNYFGECCLWWGIGLMAQSSAGTVWALIGPALLTFLLLRVSGVTLLERQMLERHPAYRDYAARTSAFFPMPPRMP